MSEIHGINFYLTEWGQFQIPEDLVKTTQWRKGLAFSWRTGKNEEIFLEAKAVPENWPFFKWLHDEEVKEGKPEVRIS